MKTNMKDYKDAVAVLEELGSMIKELAGANGISILTEPEFSIKLIDHNIVSYGYFFSYKGNKRSIWIGFCSEFKSPQMNLSHAVSLAVHKDLMTAPTANQNLPDLNNGYDDWYYLPLFLYCNSSNPIDQSAFDSMISQMITALGI